MKKLISRRNFLKVCALAGSAAALSACGGGKSTGSGNSAAADVDVTGAVTFPLSEKVTFTGMTSFPVGSEPEPNNRTIFKRLEEQTNVHTKLDREVFFVTTQEIGRASCRERV